MISATHNNVHIYKSLHALMNGGSAYTALGGNILEWYAGIIRDNFQNLFVERINLFHGFLYILTHKGTEKLAFFQNNICLFSIIPILTYHNIYCNTCLFNEPIGCIT